MCESNSARHSQQDKIGNRLCAFELMLNRLFLYIFQTQVCSCTFLVKIHSFCIICLRLQFAFSNRSVVETLICYCYQKLEISTFSGADWIRSLFWASDWLRQITWLKDLLPICSWERIHSHVTSLSQSEAQNREQIGSRSALGSSSGADQEGIHSQDSCDLSKPIRGSE